MSENNSSFIYTGTIIHSKTIQELKIIETGLIVVVDGKIVELEEMFDKLSEFQTKYNVTDDNVNKLQYGQFIIPGFVDTHIHAPQYPNIGLGYDMTLLDWLQSYTFPLETKYSDEQFSSNVYRKVIERTLRNGTTTCSYYGTIHRTSCEILCDLAVELGQRALIGKVNMNINTPNGYGETEEESLSSTEQFIQYVLGKNSCLVQPVVTPRFALSCDLSLMTKLAQLAKKYDVNIQTHISENKEEVDAVASVYPDCQNYAHVYDKCGLLTPKTILAHGVFLTDDELTTIRDRGTSVSHCPTSNTCLQSGLCSVRRLLENNVSTGLGTDCAGGSTVSMLETIRNAMSVSTHLSFIHSGVSKLNIGEVLYLATLGGARALGLDKSTGNFEIGKDFDGLVINLNNQESMDLLEQYTSEQLLQKFIYLADDRNIDYVYVAGRHVSGQKRPFKLFSGCFK